ncbi:elongation factor G [Shewanella submarina]|uniref:Elongation factor G n=1 Tax=Shewanella submarina TaxID=2016376 RepID=A0ABV7GJ05_9GAMM|nr:elongation factor G [Shewanella submarina]MCL1036340.1 elongation factor G [Shewanella submarina]
MAEYRTGQIRNFAVLGHTGAGKSSLLEALLFGARTIAQKGRVDKGTNHADFTAQEKAHQHSLEPSFLNIDHDGHHINLIDTPGLPDFFGRALQPLPAVESVLLVINAATGIESVTARAFAAARAQGKAVMLVVNHIDGNEDRLEALLADIQQQFGPRCLPVNLPGDDCVVDCYLHPAFESATRFSDVTTAHEQLVETVLEEDDKLMELYLEQGENLSPEQLHEPLEIALRMGHLVPVCFTSAEQDTGIPELLELLIQLMPNPREGNPPQFVNGTGDKVKPVDLSTKSTDHVLAHVFRVNIDPYFGRMAIMRVYQGKITNGMKLFAGVERKPFKVTHLLSLQGDKQVEMGQAVPGDICALAKIDELEVGSVLHESHDEDEYHLPPLVLPQPIFGLAVSSKRRGDEQKIAEVLNKLVAEDPSLSIARNEAEGQTVLQGLGDMHLQIALEKALQVFKVDMHTEKPAVAYRETILTQGQARYRHKKQSGGAGQFGEVELRVEPLPRGEGFKFESRVVGGAIPGQFIPAVEKGVKEAMKAGELGSYPVEDIKVTVLDGKHHSVDSKEIAFVMAGKKAFMDAVSEAKPVILEPIVQMQIKVDSAQVGDITGDISSRRGFVCGTESDNDGRVVVSVEAPLATVDDFATRLKSITGGEGEYTMAFARYEPVPEHVQQQMVSEKA